MIGPVPRLTSLTLQAYVAEVRSVVGSARYRLRQLSEAASRWNAAEQASSAGVRAKDYDSNKHMEDLHAQLQEQMLVFEELEFFLMYWARLSLLFFPTGRKPLLEFTRARGEVLRHVFQVAEDHPLRDRELRDAWMHFDERLDHVIATAGRWGSRQRFTRIATPRDQAFVLRLIEVDTLTIGYLDAKGQPRSQRVPELDVVLAELEQQVPLTLSRFRERFPEERGRWSRQSVRETVAGSKRLAFAPDGQT